ncbi:UNVERIFIED_CONTAM: hypothetical protein HDU68_003544 [Siphonaria sp. JEL0065]|nr:hypothetical protein HDU68_003544 [Siphonaria sp. JEL0065]
MFPVGSLYLFNRPDMQEKLLRWGRGDQIHIVMGVPEEDMVKNLPRTSAEAKAQIEILKRVHQERQARAAEENKE